MNKPNGPRYNESLSLQFRRIHIRDVYLDAAAVAADNDDDHHKHWRSTHYAG